MDDCIVNDSLLQPRKRIMWRLRHTRRKALENPTMSCALTCRRNLLIVFVLLELSDRLAGIEEGVAMANYRGARNEILLLCMKAAMPPEKREMAD
ncbi:hypothetical protein PIB30_098045 [Stylosanthes scabra]|uniref:Uncharacterized protein n=1 Tax=Stylosanthes scabra TaxID=79078 RepID=A0ABU6QXC0_9FABA|nr:hypothetical protein [Stylosanthes scabra]